MNELLFDSFIGVASINDKKIASRRPISASTANSATISAKRSTVHNKGSTVSSVSRKEPRVESASANNDKIHIQTLSQLCEAKTKQLKTLSIDHNYLRLAFDSLSVVIRHLTEQVCFTCFFYATLVIILIDAFSMRHSKLPTLKAP